MKEGQCQGEKNQLTRHNLKKKSGLVIEQCGIHIVDGKGFVQNFVIEFYEMKYYNVSGEKQSNFKPKY